MLTLSPTTGYIEISGPLNYQSVPELWKQALPILAKQARIEIDLTQVSSSNSAGLALLLELVKHAKSHQKTICFHQVPHQLASIARTVGLDKLLVKIE